MTYLLLHLASLVAIISVGAANRLMTRGNSQYYN